MPFEIKLEDKVAIITMDEGENRLNLDFLAKFMDALDHVEKQTDANVLVVRGAHEKIYSNGIDLEWLVPILQKKDQVTAKKFIETMMALFRRIALYPMITIAAITGHAFAGGAIMCCYFDFRFMRQDRGFLCFPEVDLGIPFLPGMMTAMKKAIPRYKLDEMVLTGKRITAQECLEHQIITGASHIDQLMNDVMEFAKLQNKRRPVVELIKAEMNKEIIQAIDVDDKPIIESGRFYV
ncbi:MAG TPA: enoyl-CoA hydratase/isomerase family protein [Smithellaceae bacterium]|jgi:enoyl-CoA hydratase/carnithine racemase|nr:enoyl-CoA hydratase/isomerase family protein [Syntrophaceae bacterium]HPL96828.1 enoyl-CoA hydratase/isomerase family protein [Smithellaceae bacterium]HPV49527.1 enoyl-CoA hydratase/isomerase family protein [Smithellaceae bacterium]